MAAELGVADLLRDGPRGVDDLAATTSTDPRALYRLLRALAAVGVFTEIADRRFALSAMGEFLRRDHPLSMDPAARMFGADYQWQAWSALRHSVETGENTAVHALGVGSMWEYRRRHPSTASSSTRRCATLSAGDNPGVLAAHDFRRYGVVADIGGGTGAVLAAVLAAHPGVHRGSVRPAGTWSPTRRACWAPSPTASPSFPATSSTVCPPARTPILLVRILHDWEDEEALRILRNVRAAMTPNARLVVIDSVLGPPDEDQLAKFLDLMMLVSAGGRERTEEEWRALLADAGLELVGVRRATPTRHVIEARPA